jgi:hypothetical protein
MSLQRKKTEMVGSLILPAEDVIKEAGSPESSKDVVKMAMETAKHLEEDLKKSCNLAHRKTEMYGTLIVDARDDAVTGPPSPPGPKKPSKWNQPMDQVRSIDRRMRHAPFPPLRVPHTLPLISLGRG